MDEIIRPAPMPEPIAHHTSLVLLKFAGWLSAEIDRLLENDGLKVRHYSVLSALTYSGITTQQALGDKLRIDRATMVTVVDDLENLGWVERQRNLEDRRFYHLILTETGKAQLQKIESVITQWEDVVFAPLIQEERARFDAALSQLFAGQNAVSGSKGREGVATAEDD